MRGWIVVVTCLWLGGCGKAERQVVPASPAVLRTDRILLKGHPEEAATALKRLASEDRDTFHAQYRLGVIAVLDHPDSAAAFLTRAASLNPHHPGPPFFLGLAALRRNDRAAAEPLLERGYALARARAGYALEDTTTVLRDALRAVEQLRPRDGTAALRDAARADSSNVDLWYLWANAVYRAGDPDTAREILDHVITLRPGFPEAFALQAACLYRLGRRPAAQIASDRALELNPEQSLALYVSGTLASDNSQYLDAFLLTYRAILADPTIPEYYQYLGSDLIRYSSLDLGSRFLELMELVRAFLGTYLGWSGYVPSGR